MPKYTKEFKIKLVLEYLSGKSITLRLERTQINFIVETKDMKDEKSLRYDEKIRKKTAEKFFETMKENKINIVLKNT